jgi:hypothetical protein
MVMRLRFAALVVFAVAAVTLSGCASSDADQPATAPPPSVGPATGAPSATPLYGIPQPDVMTTCQQGTPFQVTKIEP